MVVLCHGVISAMKLAEIKIDNRDFTGAGARKMAQKAQRLFPPKMQTRPHN